MFAAAVVIAAAPCGALTCEVGSDSIHAQHHHERAFESIAIIQWASLIIMKKIIIKFVLNEFSDIA